MFRKTKFIFGNIEKFITMELNINIPLIDLK